MLSCQQLKQLSRQLRHSVFLDSKAGKSPKNSQNWDIFSAEPLDFNLEYTKTEQSLGFETFSQGIYKQIHHTKAVSHLPFTHGLIAYLAYDAGEHFVLKPSIDLAQKQSALNFPSSFVGFYTWSYVFEHASQRGYLSFSAFCEPSLRKKILNCIDLIKQNRQNPLHTTKQLAPSLPSLSWYKSQTFADYAEAFARVQEYIKGGDCYQVNLTQRFEAESSESALDLYFATRENIATPYSCYFTFSDTQHLLSFSPEQFICLNQRVIESKPIKGTIKNNGNEENKAYLRNSAKNQAENVMIVDLIRNDLGKVCKSNSVHVPELFKVESFNNVHHLVSHIKGELKDDINEIDAFLSCFPGGSITGAPKIRAMEIIQELEQHSRSAYCGSVFYLNYDGRFDSNILIRSVIKDANKLYCWAGGGIVADSELEDEYQESLTKVNNITGIEI